MKINSLNDLEVLKENYEIEFKKSTGKDGSGELPKDFWETYSAFANTNGGDIFLGVEELKAGIQVIGIKKPDYILKTIWDTINNQDKVNCNILNDEDIQILNIENTTIIQVHVPRANRKQKPIYLHNNPLKRTYKRQHEGDYIVKEDTVKRMLSEQQIDAKDSIFLDNYDFSDIDVESFQRYRNLFANLKPEHILNTYDNIEFLRNIGGWKKDRETKKEGLTIAGLLMFGKLVSIKEHFPNYWIDYQERPEARKESRWIDRIYLDGSWSGNLFDFYIKVYNKLTNNLKVPFMLESGVRQDETVLHEAIREAFVNTIVHADYTGTTSILIVKRPDMFGFRNPGKMRINIEQAIKGGDSDCRNPSLMSMFTMIGYSERSGFGIPKIFSKWKSQNWRLPKLHEKDNPAQTLLELKMINLIPEDTISKLVEDFGENFNKLSNNERLILATAEFEDTVNHARLIEIMDIHPSDLSKLLQKLESNNFLSSEGIGKGKIYYIYGTIPLTPDSFADTQIANPSNINFGAPEVSSGGTEVSSGGNGLEFPIYGDLTDVEETLLKDMLTLSEEVRKSERFPKDKMKKVILSLCEDKYLTIKLLGQFLNRSEEYLRKEILNPLGEEKKIVKAFPQTPNDPRQAYKTE